MSSTTPAVSLSTATSADCFQLPDDPLSVFYIISIVSCLFLVLVICTGNGLVILSFIRSRNWNNTNYFILQLAIADFSMGPFTLYHMVTLIRLDYLYLDTACALRYTIVIFSACASLLALVSMTQDRYSAIVRPLTYNSDMSRKRKLAYALFIWGVSFVVGFVVPTAWHNRWRLDCPVSCQLVTAMNLKFLQFIMIPIFAVISTVITVMYARIFNVARIQSRAITEANRNLGQSPTWAVTPKTHTDRHMKMLKTAATVYVTFYLCWLPFFVVMGTQVYTNQIDNPLLNQIRTYATLLAGTNSGINPIIYALRLPSFRSGIRQLFHRDTPIERYSQTKELTETVSAQQY